MKFLTRWQASSNKKKYILFHFCVEKLKLGGKIGVVSFLKQPDNETYE